MNQQTPEVSTQTKSQIIQDEDMVWIQISLALVARECAALLSVISNVFNMVIFSKISLKDSMSVGLFALSMTDMIQSVCQITSCTCYAVDVMYSGPVDLRALGNSVIGWTVNATYRISSWITAWVSLERCLCVVFPFSVKHIFTRFRCGLVILTIYFAHMCMYIPVFISHRMEWIRKPAVLVGFNTTVTFTEVLTVILNDRTAHLEFLFDISLGIVWLCFSNITVIVCAVLLSHSLQISSKIRQAPKAVQKDNTGNVAASQLTNREKRLVKVVLVLAVILTVCNIPKYIVYMVYHTLPGMNTGGQRNLTALLWNIAPIISNIGCSVNFIVYFKLNSKFRKTARRCLCLSGRRSSADAQQSCVSGNMN